MDASNQNQGQPQAVPEVQQLPDTPAQQGIPPIDVSANMNGNGIPHLSNHVLNPMNPEALAMLGDPSLMADPSLLSMQMPMADPSFMMQPGMNLSNGQNQGFSLPVAPPPATVSAGKFCTRESHIQLVQTLTRRRGDCSL
jgi:ubiquitin-like 1-activating enzyme E1 A